MQTFIPYPAPQSFESLISELQLDSENHNQKNLNILTSEKIYGTPGAFCFNKTTDYWIQDKTKIIDYDCDISSFVQSKLKHFKHIVQKLAKIYEIDLSSNTISLFFELTSEDNNNPRAFIFQYFIVSNLDGSNNRLLYFPEDFACPTQNIFRVPVLFALYLNHLDISSKKYVSIFEKTSQDIRDNSLYPKRDTNKVFFGTFFYLGTLYIFQE